MTIYLDENGNEVPESDLGNYDIVGEGPAGGGNWLSNVLLSASDFAKPYVEDARGLFDFVGDMASGRGYEDLPAEEPSWFEAVASRAIPKGFAGITEKVGQGVKWIGEQPALPYGGVVSQLIGDDLVKRAREVSENVDYRYPLEPESVKGILSESIPAVERMILGTASGAGLAPVMGGESFLDTYEKFKNKGQSTNWANVAGALQGAETAAIAKVIPEEKAASLFGLIPQAIKTGAVLGGTSVFPETLNIALETAAGDTITPEEAADRFSKTMKHGFVTGAGFEVAKMPLEIKTRTTAKMEDRASERRLEKANVSENMSKDAAVDETLRATNPKEVKDAETERGAQDVTPVVEPDPNKIFIPAPEKVTGDIMPSEVQNILKTGEMELSDTQGRKIRQAAGLPAHKERQAAFPRPLRDTLYDQTVGKERRARYERQLKTSEGYAENKNEIFPKTEFVENTEPIKVILSRVEQDPKLPPNAKEHIKQTAQPLQRPVEQNVINDKTFRAVASLSSLLKDERGALNLRSPQGSSGQIAESERFLMNPVNRVMSFVDTVTSKNPVAKRFQDWVYREWEASGMVQSSSLQQLAPYYALPRDSRNYVFNVLQTAREHPNFRITKDSLMRTSGMSEAEADAGVAVHTYFKDYAFPQMITAMRARKALAGPEAQADWNAAIDAAEDSLRRTNYIPRGRYGQWRVDAFNPTTGEKYTRFHEAITTKRAEKLAEQDRIEMLGKGYQASKHRVDAFKVGRKGEKLSPEMEELFKDAYTANPNMKAALEEVAKTYGISGLREHMVGAKNIPGYSTDGDRVIAHYISDLGHFVGYNMARPWQEQALFELAESGKNNRMLSYLQKYDDSIHSYQEAIPAVEALKKLTVLNYLPKPITALVNFTQPLTMTQALAGKYSPKAGRIVVKNYNRAYQYNKSPDTFQGSQALKDYMGRLREEGYFSDKNFQEQLGAAKLPEVQRRLDKVSHVLLYLFGAAERQNRTHAALTAWDVAPANIKADPNAMHDFAREFINKTQGDYTKLNRPVFARNQLGSLAFLFRAMPGIQFKMLKDEGFNLKSPVVKRAIATQLALGGVTATVPFFNELEDAAKMAFGIGIKDFIRDAFGEEPIYSEQLGKLTGNPSFSDVLIYGGPALMGAAVGPMLNMYQLSQGPDKDASNWEIAMRTAAGPAVPMITDRVGGLMDTWKNTEGFSPEFRAAKALGVLAPDFLKGIIKTGEVGLTGELTTGGGNQLLESPSPLSQLYMLAGANPLELAKARDQQAQISDFMNWSRTKNEGLGMAALRSRERGDMEAAQKYENMIRSQGGDAAALVRNAREKKYSKEKYLLKQTRKSDKEALRQLLNKGGIK